MNTPHQPKSNITPFICHAHGDPAGRRESTSKPPCDIPTNAPMRRFRYELAGMDAWQADVDFAAYVAGCMDESERNEFESTLSPDDLEEARLLKSRHIEELKIAANTKPRAADLTAFRNQYLARAAEKEKISGD